MKDSNIDKASEKTQRLMKLVAAANLALVGTQVHAAQKSFESQQKTESVSVQILEADDLGSSFANCCCGNSSCSCNASC